MKFTLDWLHDHLETDATLDIICDTLNRIGLEVEEVIDPASKLAGFEVAEIVSTEQHPDADRLKICTVKSGQGEQKLVCGAPNARAGLKGILANEGAVIPANGMVLGKAKIRGVESRGMMCSLAELELSEDHDGIIELPENAVIGTPAAEALGNNGFAIDPVIEIAITPNRPACHGVRGIARGLAAAGLGLLTPGAAPAARGAGERPTARARRRRSRRVGAVDSGRVRAAPSRLARPFWDLPFGARPSGCTPQWAAFRRAPVGAHIPIGRAERRNELAICRLRRWECSQVCFANKCQICDCR